MNVIQSRVFEKKVQKLTKQEKKALDQQILKIMANCAIGEEKRGELHGVFVHKFKMHGTQYLLAYRCKEQHTLELIMIGPHENYYRDLTKYLKHQK